MRFKSNNAEYGAAFNYFSSRGPWMLVSITLALALSIAGEANQTVAVSRSGLSEDQLCELWVAGKVRDTTDLWVKRYAVRAKCIASDGRSQAVGQVVLTITLANGEGRLPDAEATELEKMLRPALDAAIVAVEGWKSRYPRQTFQFLN